MKEFIFEENDLIEENDPIQTMDPDDESQDDFKNNGMSIIDEEGKHINSDYDSLISDIPDDTDDEPDTQLQRELLDTLGQLNPIYKEILFLKYNDNLTDSQIADRIKQGWTAEAVHKIIPEIKEKLNSLFQNKKAANSQNPLE